VKWHVLQSEWEFERLQQAVGELKLMVDQFQFLDSLLAIMPSPRNEFEQVVPYECDAFWALQLGHFL
jgi:ribosome-associated toxin RatA of RatAB toxin-antitoxin module